MRVYELAVRASCSFQEGCTWTTACTGASFLTCADFTDDLECLEASCSWY